MTDACDAGAEVLVTPGYLQETALKAVAPKYPDVQFVFIDGWDMGMPNLVGVSYQEEQAGYFAGYATVMEGYTKLGFSGGGGSGAGVTITPIAFLIIKGEQVRMMPIAVPANSTADRIVEQLPELLDKLSDFLDGRKKPQEPAE